MMSGASVGRGPECQTTAINQTAAMTKLSVMLCPSDGTSNPGTIATFAQNGNTFGNPAGKYDYGDSNYSINNGWPRQCTGYGNERVVANPGGWPIGNGALSVWCSIIGPTLPESAMPSVFTPVQPPYSWTIRAKNVTDGLSKTAAASELLINPATYDPDRRRNLYFFGDGATGLSLPVMWSACNSVDLTAPGGNNNTSFSWGIGGNWAGGAYENGVSYQHLMTPNTHNCRYGGGSGGSQAAINVAMTPSSQHPGGVNVCMLDGSVTFYSNSVAKEVWWAVGSNSSNDLQ
jgi:prepilin-type processing-associated H-X9-DG protein